MKVSVHNKDELKIVDYVENENLSSVPNLADKMAKIKSAVTTKYTKRKAINIKVLESDHEKLKSKALEEVMPY